MSLPEKYKVVDFSDAAFIKSSRTWAEPEREKCVQFASKDGHVALRDSKDPTGATLVFDGGEWAAFANGVVNGEFIIQY